MLSDRLSTEKYQYPIFSPNIVHLLFDFGGVLVDLDKECCIQAFDRLGFNIRPFIGTYAQTGILSRLERGEVSVSEFCDELRNISGQQQLSDTDIIHAWEAYLTSVPMERLEMLLRAKRHYHLHLLSNTNAVHWAQAEQIFFRYKGLGVHDFFEQVFLSFEMGIEKPAPEIFQRVVQSIGCRPEEILFFDDSEVNCASARSEGLQSWIAPADSQWLRYFDVDGRLLPHT